MQYCLSCHQENGEGVEGLYPPLVNSEHVVGDKTWLIKNVLYGQQGPIIVNGKEYNNIMTPLDYLTDKEIAQVLTYVRKVFGELDSPVTEKEVQMVRAQGKDA
jgi:mono/diheme cytochrome c family protein